MYTNQITNTKIHYHYADFFYFFLFLLPYDLTRSRFTNTKTQSTTDAVLEYEFISSDIDYNINSLFYHFIKKGN